MATFEHRLKRILQNSDLTQTELAAILKVSQSAISQWLSGTKVPSGEKLVRLAEILRVNSNWLENGTGDPPKVLVERGRQAYSKLLGWAFRQEPPDGARDYGNANLWSLRWDIDTLVREAGQNILDVILENQRAEAEFKIIRLRGSALEDFLSALKWSGREGLDAHIEAATQTNQKLSTVLRNGLDQLARHKELLLLVVEDRATTGMIGEEVGEGNFAALARNNLDSTKQGGNAGGSYGLGKAVFWRASQFATVLFNSNLTKPVLIDGEPRTAGRFIGRTELPWHQVNGTNYAGPGWYGEPDSDLTRVSSIWDEATLLKDLHLSRETDATGTSIMVVGFNDPSSDKPKDMEELRDDISRAIARNFWPALESSKLIVNVSTWDNRTRQSNVRVDPENYQRSFVSALRGFKENDLIDQLTSEGDLIVRPIPLEVPKRIAPKDKHGAEHHEAILIIRRDSDEEIDELSSSLAVYRGREMVIRYESLKSTTPGAVPFRAILMCGEAAGSTDADRAAERFLRTAEPPAHNKWTSTPELQAEYAWGAKKRIDDMISEAKRLIRELVRPQLTDLDDGPQELKELLKLAGPPEKRALPRISKLEGKVVQDENGQDVWSISAWVRPPDSKRWRIQPSLILLSDSGGRRAIPWSIEAIQRCSVKDGWIEIPAGMREAIFSGRSIPDKQFVSASETAVTVSIRQAERQAGGSR